MSRDRRGWWGYRELVSDPALAPPLLTPEGAKVKPEWPVCVPSGADSDTAVAERPDADVRSGRQSLEWRSGLLRGDLKHDRTVPDTRHRSRPWRDPGGPESCSSCCAASSVTCLTRFPRTSRLITWRQTCGWRTSDCSRDWILDWLVAPLEIQPGTRMPMFWTEYPGSFISAVRRRRRPANRLSSGLPTHVPRWTESDPRKLAHASSRPVLGSDRRRAASSRPAWPGVVVCAAPQGLERSARTLLAGRRLSVRPGEEILQLS